MRRSVSIGVGEATIASRRPCNKWWPVCIYPILITKNKPPAARSVAIDSTKALVGTILHLFLFRMVQSDPIGIFIPLQRTYYHTRARQSTLDRSQRGRQFLLTQNSRDSQRDSTHPSGQRAIEARSLPSTFLRTTQRRSSRCSAPPSTPPKSSQS